MSRKRAINSIAPDDFVLGYVIDIDDQNQFILRKYYINRYKKYVDDVVAILSPSSNGDLVQELLDLAYAYANRNKVYIESFILEELAQRSNKSSN